MARFICGVCEKTVAPALKGEDVIVVCGECAKALRREVNSASGGYRKPELRLPVRPAGRAA